MSSPKYTLNSEDLLAMLKVMAWSLGATIITVLIALLKDVEVPPEYAFLLPVINSLLYSVKLFFQERGV